LHTAVFLDDRAIQPHEWGVRDRYPAQLQPIDRTEVRWQGVPGQEHAVLTCWLVLGWCAGDFAGTKTYHLLYRAPTRQWCVYDRFVIPFNPMQQQTVYVQRFSPALCQPEGVHWLAVSDQAGELTRLALRVAITDRPWGSEAE
ncbi:MAG: hypothetical protein Q7T33_01220, partial [Dehalococcoidia bacterium]|nr:hypothetical protein [Dehalococcoidia bacterium]